MEIRPIGQYLVSDRHLAQSALDKALRIQATTKNGWNRPRNGMILYQKGAVTPEDLAVELMKQKRDRVRYGN